MSNPSLLPNDILVKAILHERWCAFCTKVDYRAFIDLAPMQWTFHERADDLIFGRFARIFAASFLLNATLAQSRDEMRF